MNLTPNAGPTKSDDQSTDNRRSFLKKGIGCTVATIATCGAVIEGTRRAGLWRLADLGVGTLGALERGIQQERKQFEAGYLRNPEQQVNIEKVTRLFTATELARYLREHPRREEVELNTFLTSTYRQFMDGIKARAGEYEDKHESDTTRGSNLHALTQRYGTPSMERIVSVKLALHDQLGKEACYAAKSNNVVDGIVSKELQCRSGSRLLLLALFENIEGTLNAGERLVVIHSNQHQQVGILTADGRLIAFEMTKSGMGIQDLGALQAIEQPIIVTDAKHDLAQAAINQQAHPEQTVLFDNVPQRFDRLASIYEKGSLVGGDGLHSTKSRFGIGGSMTSTTDQYGFSDGTVQIPEMTMSLAQKSP